MFSTDDPNLPEFVLTTRVRKMEIDWSSFSDLVSHHFSAHLLCLRESVLLKVARQVFNVAIIAAEASVLTAFKMCMKTNPDIYQFLKINYS